MIFSLLEIRLYVSCPVEAAVLLLLQSQTDQTVSIHQNHYRSSSEHLQWLSRKRGDVQLQTALINKKSAEVKGQR